MKPNHTKPPYKTQPAPDPRVIAAMADQVEHGQVVTADLTDGTLVALMVELQRRGYALSARSAAQRELKPFLFKVAKANHARE